MNYVFLHNVVKQLSDRGISPYSKHYMVEFKKLWEDNIEKRKKQYRELRGKISKIYENIK